ncbi:MAG: 50S ribosomal protein L34e [Candidatus Aenigmatarchaeota archaeon]
MVRRMLRSRSFKKTQKKVPGGRTVIHYRRGKTNPARCGNCGRELKGVPRLRASEMRKLAKTERRPERPYGGVLCSECMREVFRKKVRVG